MEIGSIIPEDNARQRHLTTDEEQRLILHEFRANSLGSRHLYLRRIEFVGIPGGGIVVRPLEERVDFERREVNKGANTP